MQIDFCRARCDADQQGAFDLVSEEYKKDGYIDVDARPDIPVYNFLLTSATFIAKADKTIIGTVTIVGDGEKGLPMENIYEEEIGELRWSGKKMAEISQLAIKRGTAENPDMHQRKIQTSIPLALFRVVYFFAKSQGIGNFCIAINPKHETFYKLLGFEDIGGLKSYSFVNGAPALARMLDITQDPKVLAEKSFIFDEIIKNPLTAGDFEQAIIFSQEI
ncbi:MAG: hypothetical protein WAV46_02425 [Candidatus Moraniibacteriota bacterium]